MLAFVIGIASAWARGLRIDCGCFGGGGQLAAGVEPDYLIEILRDFGLFGLGVLDRLVPLRAASRWTPPWGSRRRAGAVRRPRGRRRREEHRNRRRLMGKAARDQSARDRIKAQREEQTRRSRRRRMRPSRRPARASRSPPSAAGWWFAAQCSRSEQVGAELAPITVHSDGSWSWPRRGWSRRSSTSTRTSSAPPARPRGDQRSHDQEPGGRGQGEGVYHPITIFQEPTNRPSPGVTPYGPGRPPAAFPAAIAWRRFHDKLFDDSPRRPRKASRSTT